MHPAALLLAAAAVVACAAELKPYQMSWRSAPGTLVHLSFLNHAPAGKHGFVHVRNGHLVTGNGERLRLWGVNFSFTGNMPAKPVAKAAAEHLARFGVNAVRIHHHDWRSPRGIIDSKHPDSRHFDPENLDKLDFFIAQLKRHGIYVNLNLNVARAFQEADGVKESDAIGYAKAITYFDPRIIELQKEFARVYLTHRNPYTGNEYRNEPAIATVEIVNENSLVESWIRGRLQGKGRPKGDATWSDIPASYERDLTELFGKYLDKRGLPRVTRMSPADIAHADESRFRTEAAFYVELERAFFDDMGEFLRNEVGVKVPITGTSVHAAGLSPYPLLSSTSRLDLVDAHTYWQHPVYHSDPATGRRTGFEIRNTPAVNDPGRSPVVALARAAVAGKPFMVSEVNHPYPNEYASEGIPLLAAYGAFQDWDAIYWYSFEHNAAETWDTPRLPNPFDMRQDPVKMTQWAAAALLFRRGDVATAKQIVGRTYSTAQVLDSLRLPSSDQPLFTPGMSPRLPLVHGIRIKSFDTPGEPLPGVGGNEIISDTGQLTWTTTPDAQGLVVVNSPASQAIIGYLGRAHHTSGNMKSVVSNLFGALMLTSLNRSPIAKSRKLLLVAGARTGNKGQRWNDKRTTTPDMGEPGMTIEPIEGEVLLTGLDRARSVEATPLDGAGAAAGPPVKAERIDGSWRIPLGSVVTPWYLISVAR